MAGKPDSWFPAWYVRVHTASGGVSGTGLLVGDRHVLTSSAIQKMVAPTDRLQVTVGDDPPRDATEHETLPTPPTSWCSRWPIRWNRTGSPASAWALPPRMRPWPCWRTTPPAACAAWTDGS